MSHYEEVCIVQQRRPNTRMQPTAYTRRTEVRGLGVVPVGRRALPVTGG